MTNLATAVQILADGQRAADFFPPADPCDEAQTLQDAEKPPEAAQNLQPGQDPPTGQTSPHVPEAEEAATGSLGTGLTVRAEHVVKQVETHGQGRDPRESLSLGTSQNLKGDQNVKQVETHGQGQDPRGTDPSQGSEASLPHVGQPMREGVAGDPDSAGEDAGETPEDEDGGPREAQYQLAEGQVESMIGACLQVAPISCDVAFWRSCTVSRARSLGRLTYCTVTCHSLRYSLSPRAVTVLRRFSLG